MKLRNRYILVLLIVLGAFGVESEVLYSRSSLKLRELQGTDPAPAGSTTTEPEGGTDLTPPETDPTNPSAPPNTGENQPAGATDPPAGDGTTPVPGATDPPVTPPTDGDP